MQNRCKHCGMRIVKVNFALGETWVHQVEGASGWDGQYQYCKTQAAEPESENDNKKYVVHPGWVKSQTDGDVHWVSFLALCRLYKVDPQNCIDASSEYSTTGRDLKAFENHLYPKSSGDYP